MQGYVSSDLGEITAVGLSKYEELTGPQRVRFFWYVVEHALQLQNVLNIYKQGMLSDFDYETWVNYVCSFVNTPGGRVVWPQMARVVSPDVCDVINQQLAKDPDHPSILELLPVLDARSWEDQAPGPE